MERILEVQGLKKVFEKNKVMFCAVKNVSFSIEKGECLGLIGESGSGKSTVANLISGLLDATEGQMRFLGADLAVKSKRKARELRKEMQMVFQDPVMSFSPKMKLLQSIGEGARYYTDWSRQQREERVLEALDLVGLQAEYAKRKSWEISGGECQRAAIARAILIRPKLLICDEVTSALDVSVQAQIIGLLADLKKTRDMSFLFISHDLALVSGICDRIAVMYQGEILEIGKAEEVIQTPRHPYTKVLLQSVFLVDKETVNKKIINIMEEAQRAGHPCCYAGKCREYGAACSGEKMVQFSESHWAKCEKKEPSPAGSPCPMND